MYEAIEQAIKLLCGQIAADTRSDDAMKYAQAALNLAHTKVTLKNAQ